MNFKLRQSIIASLSIFCFTSHADSMQVGQFVFNGMLNNFELNQLEQNIQQNNANKVMITFNGPMILLANNIKAALNNQYDNLNIIMENLVNANSAIYYYGVSNWYNYNVLVTTFTSDNPTKSTQPTQINQQSNSNDFYDYTNKDSSFYDYDNKPNNN